MAQEQLVALRLGEPPGRYLARLQRILPGPPQRAQVVRLGFQATVGVEQVAVGRRVHQAALVELALDLDQQVGEAAQPAGRGGLVVHVGAAAAVASQHAAKRSEEHTSELQSLMRHSYAVFCLEKNRNCYT